MIKVIYGRYSIRRNEDKAVKDLVVESLPGGYYSILTGFVFPFAALNAIDEPPSRFLIFAANFFECYRYMF